MSARLLSAYIEGVALWSNRVPTWDAARAVICGETAALVMPLPRPAPQLLAPTERRRAPDTVAVALEVASQACAAADRTPQELSTVFASTHGDLAISDYMCATLADNPTLISPTKFHNSVHNAAAGYWTIGTQTHAPYTAISAFEHTFAVGLLEAVTQLLCDECPVLYVAYDIEARGPMATMTPSKGLFAVALVLSNVAERGRIRLDLQLLHDANGRISSAHSPAAELLRDNALANAVPFFEALASDEPQSLQFAAGGLTLRATVTPRK